MARNMGHLDECFVNSSGDEDGCRAVGVSVQVDCRNHPRN